MRNWLILLLWVNLLLDKSQEKGADDSEFYMNEYECINKVLFDPKVFYVLQNQDEKACEIGVNFNLEQIFRKAEQTSLDEEGFKAIIEILDGKFGVGENYKEELKVDEVSKEAQYNMELQQLTIEYLKSNLVRQNQLTESYENRNSDILTPELADEYMGKLKTIASMEHDNFALIGQNMHNVEFQNEVTSTTQTTSDEINDEEIQLNSMSAPVEGIEFNCR